MTSCKRSKSSAPPASYSYLPDEIVEQILLRLPASSTFRFRAVCRSWAALLSSPSFAGAYAAEADVRSRRSASQFVLFAPPPAASPGRAATAVYSCRAGAGDEPPPPPLLFTIDGLRPGFLVVSSKPCHGLVLLTDTRSFAYWVCNPSSGEFRRLPRPRRHEDGLSSAGLAYDERTREHKVVHLFCRDPEGADPTGCEVYTLCSPSRQWRPAAGGGPRRLGDATTHALIFEGAVTKVPPVFANGRLHWQIYPNMGMDYPSLFPGVAYPYYSVTVLFFSVADETFGLVTGPAVDDLHRVLDDTSPAVPLHLVELQGSLCMVRDLRGIPHGETLMKIWALTDYRASTWSLLHRIDMAPRPAGGVRSPRFVTVLGYLGGSCEKTNNKIPIATSEHKVHAYDLATGHVDTVFAVPENAAGFLQEEAAAGVRLALYEDNLARTGGESRRQTEEAAALTEILLRLPVRSIGQCMLVCKLWHTLIQSESFTVSHLRASRRRRKVVMVTNGRARKSFFGFMPVETWLQGTNNAAARLETLLVDDGDIVVCSKPCHGLNLISTGTDDYLCNPCTGSTRCLGLRGKFRGCPRDKDHCPKPSRRRRHAFTVGGGRSVGLGFDSLAREHVAVEISHTDDDGALVCMVKTSCAEYWTRAGEPPRPVTDMPPAHVGGTLYWMSEPDATTAGDPRVVVAFHIPTRGFTVLPCQPACSSSSGIDGGSDPFLVELGGALSLVVPDVEGDVLRIWVSREHGTWVHSCNIYLENHHGFSLRTVDVVVPLEVDGEDGCRILLNTGRALGYYDTRTRAIDAVLYSLDRLQLPRRVLAFPVLCEESLAGIQDDELPDHVAPPLWVGDDDRGSGGEEQQQQQPRYIFRPCERSGCRAPAAVHASCCRRVLCRECGARCDEHTDDGSSHAEFPPGSPRAVKGIWEHMLLPLEHPSVRGPEYCYYYSVSVWDEVEEGVGRHVFVAVKDLVRYRQPCRQVKCGYRMDGRVVRETWVYRYRGHDEGDQ